MPAGEDSGFVLRRDAVRFFALCAGAVALFLAAAGGANAAPADFDPFFGTGGKVTRAVVPSEDSGEAVAVQTDGKVVVAGSAFTGANYDFAVARFNADGTPDTTFGGDGDVTTAIGSGRDMAYALAIQPDGKIVVAGYLVNGPSEDFCIVRYLSDGTPDPEFGSGANGRVTVYFGLPGANQEQAHAVTIQPDGRIIVAGYSNLGVNRDFAVARLLPNGLLDGDFDTDGRVVTPIGTSTDQVNSVAVQPDGKIVAAGESDDVVTDYDFAVARYDGNGTLDSTFNGTGKQRTAIDANSDYGEALAIQADGKIVVSGSAGTAGGLDEVALIRYLSTGALDVGFGAGGVVRTPFGPGEAAANSIALQNNGKIVVGGGYYDGLYTDFLVNQYDSTGALDPSFDGDGILTFGFGAEDDYANGVAIQSDGKIVVAGTSRTGAGFDFAVARLAGELPVAPPAEIIPPPSATITSPRGRKIKAKKLKKFAGTAGPAGQVAKVEIALRRVDRRALKRGRCLWLKSAKAKFVKTKARRKRCSKPRFLAAKGLEKWSYRLRARLKKGSYELYVRVTLKNGDKHTVFEKSKGNFRAFKVG